MAVDQVQVYNLVHDIRIFSYLSQRCQRRRVWEGAHRSASPSVCRWNGRKSSISLQGLESVCKCVQGCLAGSGKHVKLGRKYHYPCGPGGGAYHCFHSPVAKSHRERNMNMWGMNTWKTNKTCSYSGKAFYLELNSVWYAASIFFFPHS